MRKKCNKYCTFFEHHNRVTKMQLFGAKNAHNLYTFCAQIFGAQICCIFCALLLHFCYIFVTLIIIPNERLAAQNHAFS